MIFIKIQYMRLVLLRNSDLCRIMSVSWEKEYEPMKYYSALTMQP